jgi:acyl-homoserine lactone acylase PvdQ
LHDAALVPVRTSGEWVGWTPFDRLPHAVNARGGSISASGVPNTAASPRNSTAGFAHPLAVNDAARKRFNIGPIDRPADDNPVRIVFDLRDWDRSRAINAPGQSGSASSPHFSDLAAAWASGEYFPLVFSDAAVQANQESVLMLTPARSSAARPEARALPTLR